MRFRTRGACSDQNFIENVLSSCHLDELRSNVYIVPWKFITSFRRNFPQGLGNIPNVCNQSFFPKVSAMWFGRSFIINTETKAWPQKLLGEKRIFFTVFFPTETKLQSKTKSQTLKTMCASYCFFPRWGSPGIFMLVRFYFLATVLWWSLITRKNRSFEKILRKVYLWAKQYTKKVENIQV